MPKNGNLLRFWESLESSQQSNEPKQPFRPNHGKVANTASQIKMRSISHGNLLGQRQNITHSTELFRDLNEGDSVIHDKNGVKADGNELKQEHANVSESLRTECNGALPLIERHEVLTNATQGRARRAKKKPARQSKQNKQVPVISLAQSAEKKLLSDAYQTPPAASTEFSRSPTSARFLDKSPITSCDPVVSPNPVRSLARTPLSFSTFLSDPYKKNIPQTISTSTGDETVEDRQRKRIHCSPKLSERYKEKVESDVQPVFYMRSPSKFDSPKPQISSNMDSYEKRSATLKPSSTSKPDFVDRRNSLKAVTSPYKTLQESILSLKSEQSSISLSEKCKNATTSSNLGPNNKLTGDKGEQATTIVNSTALKATQSYSPLNSSESVVAKDFSCNQKQDMNTDFKEYINYFDSKIETLEGTLLVEKQARIILEEEVTKLKLLKGLFL